MGLRISLKLNPTKVKSIPHKVKVLMGCISCGSAEQLVWVQVRCCWTQRNPILEAELSGVLTVRAATR